MVSGSSFDIPEFMGFVKREISRRIETNVTANPAYATDITPEPYDNLPVDL